MSLNKFTEEEAAASHADYENLSVPRLVELALARGEGVLTSTGALRVTTGKYTGRSPEDKFIVDYPEIHDRIWWGPNKSFEPAKFDRLYRRLKSYLAARDNFVFNGFVGADPDYRIPLRVINEYAWQNLFVRQLFLRPTAEELPQLKPEYTLICAPGFKAAPELDGTNSEAFIILDFKKKVIIIGGTEYAGEMKKSIFTVMNYLLPQQGVLPMHCSANLGSRGDVALFFGLSGTGKTTLSADPGRFLIGDDEHGWSREGIFNFEGGCYAKCIRLSPATEPQIFGAIKFGAVVENVVIDEYTRVLDFESEAITENTRAAYPVDYIPNAVIPGVAGIPQTVIFLTADAFGVLPPVSRLNKDQAMYHFLSGYTSKLAGTERGITEPQATFSTCFGAPFLPLQPGEYAALLGRKIEEHEVDVYLVNTGWSGGPYGTGQRIKLDYTRSMVGAALSGALKEVPYRRDPFFGVMVPQSCPAVPAAILNPRQTWPNGDEYDDTARKLAALFRQNFCKFQDVSPEVAAAGPSA